VLSQGIDPLTAVRRNSFIAPVARYLRYPRAAPSHWQARLVLGNMLGRQGCQGGPSDHPRVQYKSSRMPKLATAQRPTILLPGMQLVHVDLLVQVDQE